MTQSELIQLFRMIDIDYPNNQIAKDEKDRKLFAARWFQKLSPYDAKLVYAAYEIHAARQPAFAPNWQHLTSIIFEEIKQSQTAEQAWGRLLTAVRKFGHTMPVEAETFLGDIWPLVSQFTWRYFCEMPPEKESTYFAQFRNAYNAESKRATEKLQIPATIRQALESGRLQIGDGANGVD